MTKKILRSGTITLLLFIGISAFLSAEVTLPAIFGDHMVLQQQFEANLWGKAQANKKVTLSTSWNNETYSAKSDENGAWRIKVKTPAAGGPYEITISDGTPLTLKNILIGEVWICGGQSNMQMPMKGYRNQPIIGANAAIATSSNDHIRLFTVERAKSLNVSEDFAGSWLKCEPQNVVDFSATAYFFGLMIHQALGVPVGLISSNWGGTRIEPWISENGFAEYDWVNLPDKDMQDNFSQQTPTVLFNAMIAPMAGYGIRGALWYQGESNRNEPGEYEKLMSGLINNWRAEWNIGNFSFYYAQIAPFDYGTAGLNSAFLREAQLKASTATENTGVASLMDAGLADNIHPPDKKAAGDRLAFLALAKTYGQKGIAYSGPVLKEMEIEGSLVKLTFNHAENGLTTFGKELDNFEVAGENKRFYPAQAFITRDGISLICDRVETPVAVRYAFKDFTIGSLYNTEGLPASSFRTDDWD